MVQAKQIILDSGMFFIHRAIIFLRMEHDTHPTDLRNNTILIICRSKRGKGRDLCLHGGLLLIGQLSMHLRSHEIGGR